MRQKLPWKIIEHEAKIIEHVHGLIHIEDKNSTRDGVEKIVRQQCRERRMPGLLHT
jgi:hypothetical protein